MTHRLIRARTCDGIRRAKAAGVHMGRPLKLTKHQQWEVLARLYQGEETLVEIARSYAVSHMTIFANQGAVRSGLAAQQAILEALPEGGVGRPPCPGVRWFEQPRRPRQQECLSGDLRCAQHPKAKRE